MQTTSQKRTRISEVERVRKRKKQKRKKKCLFYSVLLSCFFLFLTLSISEALALFWVVVCMLLSYWLFIISLVFLCFAQSAFCFRGSRLLCTWWRKACLFETSCKVFILLMVYQEVFYLFNCTLSTSFLISWEKHIY